ncbi:hypothetical protein AU252_06780 [Pseudarthrobacter sulfonivorans]|uniref:Uncharacterized protein n=1 Tax=Pseudarthrobacter sulfonivorans TaxID=121292 RepID=A0A0U3GP02_9MICC|nr:hypothetical protein [Pseudarthrobacter sulfonivorans]ALV40902.1 hypothetical protein AU252_06780 [Pseudarthrobacter sulfonivorans]
MSGAKPEVAHEATDGPAAVVSWRDSVPEASATDLENLLGTGVGAAQEQLERNGGFLPFALVVENDGEVRLVAVTPADAQDGSDGDFDADTMISDLTELLRQNRVDFRAAAIVCDILLVEEEKDAIHVAAEHRDGSVFAAVLPYAANTGTHEWEFGQLAADTSEPTVWVD